MSILMTGFPGFLGSELLPRVLRRTGGDAVCLVQAKFRALAESRAEAIAPGRVRLVEGDITRPLEHVDVSEVTEIYHLAAVYDLSVRRDLAMAVNVEGTKNVLDLAQRAPKLERLHYVSTCYVSGRHPGLFRESDLETGQRFNNFYEETKQLAEVEVRRRMGTIPSTVYRPGIVVGDSTTGATQKFDGPYFVMQWILRQPKLAVLPVSGDPKRHTINVVPSDFVIGAIETLSATPASVGQTYALADPAPLTVDRMIDVIGEVLERNVLRVPLPLSVAKGALRHVPGVYRLMRIPADAVDYFVHPTDYDTTNATRDLGGLRPPPFPEYAPRLAAFLRAHPEIGSRAMV